MNTYYKNDLNKAYMIIESEEKAEVDYQTFMLQENVIPGLLSTTIRYVDNQSCYRYDISGKVSLQSKYEKSKLTEKEMVDLIRAILAVTKEVRRYMLDGNKILLEPEYIYCDGDKFSFAYYPLSEQQISDAFHRLTEFFVREVDYREKTGVHLAYTLHKASMEENYSIERIMEEMTCEQEEQEEPEEELMEVAEEKNVWGGMRKFWERRRSKKWGNW